MWPRSLFSKAASFSDSNTMNADWQTWAAAGIVLATLAIFTIRLLTKPKGGKSGCGHDCGCGKKTGRVK